MLTREEILNKAYHDCMFEMYAKAQPEADWDNIVEEYRTGKLGKEDRVYERHYLSMDEFLYIRDKYKTAYNIVGHWKEDADFLINTLIDGGLKDKYNPEVIDEDGFRHPPYRSAEEVGTLRDNIAKVLEEYIGEKNTPKLRDEIGAKIIELLENYKDFYRFDREEENFDINISLGASPCCNAETVKKWWKDNYDVNIEIEERNPKLFWYRDMEYTDEDLVAEFDSENWKEIVDKEWEEEKAEKKRKQEEALKALEEEYTKFKNSIHKDPIGEKGDDAKEVISKTIIENEISNNN